ncbi:ENR1 protein, partial [Arenaria interpres]|nr:ENR1 protein [Arenaria interpres]
VTNSSLFRCKKEGMNPFSGIKDISQYWENIEDTTKGFWQAPDGLFWICGNRVFPELPPNWGGTCTLGIIQPGFFLLPSKEGDELGVPV